MKSESEITSQNNPQKPAFSLLPGNYAISQLGSQVALPDWALVGDYWAVVRTTEELSLVCRSEQVPEGVRCEKDWRILKVKGPLDFSLVGLLASLTGILAEAGVSVYAISTYNTDYVLVRQAQLAAALEALQQAGFHLEPS
jgi:hypothetical protein